MPIFDWSKTPANNATADPTINFAPQMAPSAVGPSGRALMTAVANWRDDIAGAIVTTGTSTAYSISSNSFFDTEAHLAGQLVAFTPHATNGTGPVTLAVDGLGPYALRSAPNVELPGGVLIEGTPYTCVLNQADGAFYLQGFYGNPYNVPLGVSLEFWGATAPNSSFAFPFGQAISRTIYSALFAVIGTTYGAGDGSTTFNLPDVRGRLTPSMDNMGGTAANRITSAGSGIAGTTLGATGGEEAVTIAQSGLPNVSPTFTGTAVALSRTVVDGTSALSGGVNVAQTGSGIAFNGSPTIDTPTVTAAGTVSSLNGGVTQTKTAAMPPSIVCNRILRII